MRPTPRTLLLSATLLGAALGACKAGGSSAEQRCLDMNANMQQANEAHCECDVAEGIYPDVETCIESQVVHTADLECVCAAYDEHPELLESFNCIEPPSNKYAACMAATDCDDAEEDECFAAYVDATLACPDPPAEAVNEVAGLCSP